MAKPKFSVSEITTIHETYHDDLRIYREAGAEGIGIWEFKLPEGEDAASIEALKESGLAATTCIPATLSIFPVPFPGPDDPAERTQALCDAIRRFAPFEPIVVLCLTGYPPADLDEREARTILVDGLRKAARVAAEHDLILGLEPLHRHVYGTWSTIGTIPETIELMDEIDEPNVQLLYDVYHLHDTENVLEDTVKYGSRIVPSVHICDWREETRHDFDRALPGDGIIDLAAMLGALEAGGVSGWVDLEIFSDDGTFTDLALPDSHWKEPPLDVVKRGIAGFERAWESRTAPV